jgi:hypothetical protein
MRLKHTLTYLFLLALPVVMPRMARAQSEETVRALQVDADSDEAADSASKAEDEPCCLIKKHSYIRFLYGDAGMSAVFNTVGGKNETANGLTWALGANLAYKIPAYNPNRRMFISGGIEVRNFNATATETDRFGGTAYNNLQYWYAGIPVLFQVVNTKCAPGKKCAIRYYGQVGFSFAARINITNYYSMQGTNTSYDISEHYNTFIFQPMASAGLSINTPRCTYLLGPYCGYTVNNMLSNTGITENILSYGLRLTTLFLHK